MSGAWAGPNGVRNMREGGDSLTTSDIICMTLIEFDLVPIYSFFYTLSILIYAKVERSSACLAYV